MEFSFGNIKSIQKASVDSKKNQLKLFSLDSENNKVILVFDLDKYCSWVNKNMDKYQDVFMDFISEFLKESKEEEYELSEIIDKYGNIMIDDDKPSSIGKRAVGDEIHADSDKIYSQSIARRKAYMYGGPYFGYGYITW